MANSSNIRVEGGFATLSMAGFPLLLWMQLQTSELKLCDAMWTAKSSTGGFSDLLVSSGLVSPQSLQLIRGRNRSERERQRQCSVWELLIWCKR